MLERLKTLFKIITKLIQNCTYLYERKRTFRYIMENIIENKNKYNY